MINTIIRTVIIIWSLLVCGWLHVQAQDFPKFLFTRSYNQTELPSKSTFYLLKARDGFLWMSTNGGLSRYDGKKSKNFTITTDSLRNNTQSRLYHLVEDKQGNIWIGFEGKIACFRKADEKIIYYPHNPKDSSSCLGGSMPTIVVDTSGQIFITNNDGYLLQKFNPQTQKFKYIHVDTTNDGLNNPILGNGHIGRLVGPYADGGLYFLSIHGLFSFDSKTYARKRVSHSFRAAPMLVHVDMKGRRWTSEWSWGISMIDEKTGNAQNVIADVRCFHFVNYKAPNGKYWIIGSDDTKTGLVVIDPETKKYAFQMPQIENEKTPNSTPIIFYSDDKGNLYYSSSVGLMVSMPSRQAIQNTFTYERGKPTEIYNQNLVKAAVVMPNGGLLASLLNHGILWYDQNMVLQKKVTDYWDNGEKRNLDVRDMCRLANGSIMMIGDQGILQMKNEVITPLISRSKKDLLKEQNLAFHHPRKVLPKNDHEVWVADRDSGIAVFDFVQKKFTRYYMFGKGGQQFPLTDIRNILYDQQNRLWLATLDQVFKYDENADEFIAQPVNQKKNIASINYLCFDQSNQLWLCGLGELIKYDLETGTEEKMFRKLNLPDNDLLQLTIDKENKLWILHRSGLASFDQKTGRTYNYSEKDGLPVDLLEDYVPFFVNEKNQLILGNTGFICKIDIPQLEEKKLEQSKIVITAVQAFANNKSIAIDATNHKTVELTYEDFPVNIQFSIIDFSAQAQRKYFYRYKDSKDSTWLESIEGLVPINTIVPGTYTIEVTGSVNGIMSAQKDEISFTIVAKWYQTTWFKMLAFCSLLFAIFQLYRWRIRTAKKTESQQTEIQRLAAEKYKNQLELSQISNYFSNSLIHLNTEDEVLWDVSQNLISQLGFEDCMMYLWNDDKTKMIQKAGYGPKGSLEEIQKQPFEVLAGQGVVGYVAAHKESVLIPDTRKDARYRIDEMERLSEICVPIIHENELLGVIDSEHSQLNFFTQQHLQIMQTIASHIANKIVELRNKTALAKKQNVLEETINELKGAQLDALRSQMNPHFIFNSLNSIENFILQNDRLVASEYLGKFSKLIRNILDNSKSEKISLRDEIETMQLYTDLEKIRTNSSFDVVFELPDYVMDDNITLPPMLMQPHAENAILHGLRHLESRRGVLKISLSITDDSFLTYTLEDNGIGRKQSIKQKSSNLFAHKSHGLNITQNRIDLYNQKYHTNISFETIDLFDEANNGMGTKIIIIIPLI